MSHNVNMSRVRRAFVEGRRLAMVATAENPYINTALASAWDKGRRFQQGNPDAAIPPRPRGQGDPARAAHLRPAKHKTMIKAPPRPDTFGRSRNPAGAFTRRYR